MGRKLVLIALAVVLLLSIAAGGAAYWVKSQYTAPGALFTDVTMIIERGSGLKSIARQLQKEGVIANAIAFEIGARYSGPVNDLHAGEFAFKAHTSPQEVLAVLKSGKTVLRRFTIAEGLTTKQILEQINDLEGLKGDIYFAPPPEGALLPETYFFSYGEDRQDIVRRMQLGMNKLLHDLWQTRAPDLPLKTPEQALVLASIVEKETGMPEERAHVAAVFINRLRIKMRLQSDPTVAYGITQGMYVLDRPLSKADLKQKTDYNTYIIRGLPPGPIASPGREALKAVMHPAVSQDFYFVADGTGGHAFAKTLSEHNRNVRKWRKLQKSN